MKEGDVFIAKEGYERPEWKIIRVKGELKAVCIKGWGVGGTFRPEWFYSQESIFRIKYNFKDYLKWFHESRNIQK